jgi:hypothetical protein
LNDDSGMLAIYLAAVRLPPILPLTYLRWSISLYVVGRVDGDISTEKREHPGSLEEPRYSLRMAKGKRKVSVLNWDCMSEKLLEKWS